MFLKQAKSIKTQLVILFTTASTLLLLVGLGIFYFFVIRHAFAEDNDFFADKVAALRIRLRQPNALAVVVAELNDAQTAKDANYWIRVLDARGIVVAESPRMAEVLPVAVFPPATTAISLTETKSYRTRNYWFALLTNKVQAADHVYVLQVAQDRSADSDFAADFGVVLGAVVTAGIIASALIAKFLTRTALRPLEEMTESFQRVDQGHLDERVPYTHWPQELQPVALELDQMLTRLQDSFARLTQFSADLAHELRTPVANILGTSQVALTQPRHADEYREVLESNAAECERLARVIDNLLFLARAEASDRRITRVRFDGRAALEKITDFYEPIAEEKQITLACSGEGEITADPLLFDRAISNLVDNALRFTPAGGTITLSLTEHPGQSEVIVADTGEGISSQHLPRIFDRFYRVDASRSSHGIGLGLALVKSIVELHGGVAEAESDSRQGTLIRLLLPREPETAS